MSGIMRMYWAFANEFCCFRLGVTVQGLGRRFRWDSNGFLLCQVVRALGLDVALNPKPHTPSHNPDP